MKQLYSYAYTCLHIYTYTDVQQYTASSLGWVGWGGGGGGGVFHYKKEEILPSISQSFLSQQSVLRVTENVLRLNTLHDVLQQQQYE